MTVLEAVGCGKRFGDRWVLREASFRLEAGSLTWLRGPSGSGKTTLLSLLAGLATPTVGRVIVCGEDLTRLRDHHRTAWRRDKLGLVFQDVELLRGMTAVENVLLPAIAAGGPDDRDRARAHWLLERFGVASVAATAVERLSGGERQRVGLARALLRNPPILLLDEPSSHLDAARTDELQQTLVDLAAEGVCVLAATHDPRLYETGQGTVLSVRDGALEPAT